MAWMKSSGARRGVINLAGTLLMLVALTFFVFKAKENLANIPPIAWHAQAWFAGLFSIAGVLITIGLVALIWRVLLADFGCRVAYLSVVQVIAVSQIGKYLPGNVGHFAGRAVLASSVGIPTGVAVATILIEIIWTVAIAAGVSFLAMLLLLQELLPHWQSPVRPIHLLLICGFLLVAPWCASWLVNRYFPQTARRLSGQDRIPLPRLRTALVTATLLLTCFLIMGLSLKLQLLGFFGMDQGNILTLTALFTAAWLVGYVVPGAPGGIGIREALMVLFLSPIIGPGAAVGVGITTRIFTTLGDGVGFLIGLLIRHVGVTRS